MHLCNTQMQTESIMCFSHLAFQLKTRGHKGVLFQRLVKGRGLNTVLHFCVWKSRVLTFQAERLIWKLVFSSVTKLLFQLKSGYFLFPVFGWPCCCLNSLDITRTNGEGHSEEEFLTLNSAYVFQQLFVTPPENWRGKIKWFHEGILSSGFLAWIGMPNLVTWVIGGSWARPSVSTNPNTPF